MERAFADLGSFINSKRSGPINVIEFICNDIDVAVDYYPPPDLEAPALYAYKYIEMATLLAELQLLFSGLSLVTSGLS
jgi:hypothetical protein